MAPRPPSDMLFIWVPKNAGSSIHSYLKSNKLPTAVEFHRHKTPDVLVKEGTYTRAQIQERAFAVIRNPYDRALSLWMSKSKYQRVSFERFLLRLRDGIPFRPIRYDGDRVDFCWPQHRWIFFANGERAVHHVMRFEQLQLEWLALSAPLGINHLPVLNRHRRPNDFTHFDQRTKNLVEGIYRSDFERLGYPRALNRFSGKGS